MKAGIFFTGTGPILILTSYESLVDPKLIEQLESKGITNRWDGSGVYTSQEAETAAWTYEVVIQINVGAMKADGYMPPAVKESPVTEAQMRGAVAWQIGARYCDFQTESFDGLAEDTVIFKDTIPPKYLKVLD